MAGSDDFAANKKATGGPLKGYALWSDAANWDSGLPANGDIVSAGATGYDDIAALQLSSLTLNEAGAAANIFVTGASLAIADLEQNGAGGSGMLEADATDAGAPVTVTVQHSGVEGATFEAKGAGAKFLDQAATDTASNTYVVENGGHVELSNTPYSGDVFSYTSTGTFAFKSPGAVVSSLMLGVSIGDTIELPGTVVSNVTFGSDSLTITTDAGTYDLDAVTYNPGSQIEGYTAAVDPVTGLEAITFSSPNTFTPTVQVAHSTPGPFLYLWSAPANWSEGTPIDGDSVLTTYTSLVTEGQLGVDDLPDLTLSSLTLALANHVEVEAGSSLTIESLTEGTETSLSAYSTDPTKPAVLTIDALTGSYYEAEIAAIGAGATVIDQSATDPVGLYGSGAIYFVSQGGKLEILSATPASTSRLDYVNTSGVPDTGTIALGHPGGTNAVLLAGVIPGDVLELPGTSVSNVTFGPSSLVVTTNAGTYDFTNVSYGPYNGAPDPAPITGYTAAVDPSTGLVAITFTGPDVFEENVKATSGPLAGEYLWSNAANWSRGLPTNNDTVVFADPSGTSSDDVPALTLNSLTLGAGGHVYVEGGSSLTVANLVGTAGSELFPDSADDGITAPSSVTVGSITGTGALYAAKGTGASFIDQSATDAGEIYQASSGGVFELAAAPADASSLDYVGVATFALQHPSASSAASLQGVAPGDVLELPGTSVSAVTFGAHSLSVTTDAGTYAFTNVAYATSVTGYTVAHDPTTGLEAITFTGPDVFEQNVKATSGPLAGEYLWSNAANWSRGLPVTNDTVVFAAPYSSDDITTLTLNSLTLGAGGHVYVEGGSSLTVANLVGTTGSELFPDSADDGITAPSAVTVGSITGTGALYAAKGTGASFIDQSATDAGEIYLASSGGVFELAAAPADASSLGYVGVATFALQHPSASSAASLQGVAPGDILELPGTSVNAVTFGPHSLSVTTDAGTYAFTNVAYANAVTGYTAALDPITGLEAITFTGPDVFEQNVKASSGPLAGKYLWSNPANWSNGVPVDGDSFAVADQAATGYDDLAALKLNSLSLNGSDVFVTGSSLTIDAVTGGAHTSAGGTTYIGTLHADALDAGAPVTVMVGTITDSHASFNDEYLAVGTGALFVDQSTVDAGEDYLAPQGGAVLELDATPASTSRFFYTGNGEFAFASGTGVFAFANPGASTAALLAGVAPGDALELPGTSVSAVTFGAHSLSVTTDAGTYAFTNVTYADPVAGYTAALDPTTGLVAITFTGPDVFEANVKATSGKFAGDYLWSNPANWSQGHAPVDGDAVQIASGDTVSYDDITSLSLSTLTLHQSTVNVVGHSLTIGTVDGGAVFAPQVEFGFLYADATDAGAPVTVVVDTITGTRSTYGAEGTGAIFHDNSAVDPGDTYEPIGGGTVYLAATPASGTPANHYSDFWYGNGASVLELPHAAGVSGSDIDFGPGNVLELPGSKVLSVGFTNGLSVTTDAGSYQFTGVASNVARYSWADDASTGLVAITFTKTAPAAPSLALLHDTGISATDHITNDPTLHYVLSNIADTFRFSVDGSGFSAVAPDFAAHPLADGVHTVSVEEVDPAGNASAASHLSFTLDTAAPHWTGLTASPGSGSAFAGTTVQLTLDFNEAVDVRGGTPSLTLNDGGTAVYDAAATALLGDSSKLVFDHLVTSSTPSTASLAVTGLVAHGATISDVAGNNNPADLSHVTAAFGALAINESFAPAYSANGLTRPQLELDATGHIILDAAASTFAATYGIEFLYLGLPPSTPYPPVADASHDFHMA